MQWDGSFPIKKETVPPQSVIIDLDKGIVTMPLGDSVLEGTHRSYLRGGVCDHNVRFGSLVQHPAFLQASEASLLGEATYGEAERTLRRGTSATGAKV
jgi:hypothetical protein